MICIQDIKSRAVYWVLFPILMVAFVLLNYFNYHSLAGFWRLPVYNITFLFIQLLLVNIWFSIKQKRWVNITVNLLGWGDLLLLLTLTCCFSLVNFILFYIGGLVFVLLVWMTIKRWLANSEHIPLAGLQSLALVLVLIFSWARPGINVTSDNWLLNFMH